MGNYTILVNKTVRLSADYIPKDLEDVGIPFDAPSQDPKRLLRKKAAKAVRYLYTDSARQGLNLYGISGFRSFDRQKEIYDHSVLTKGLEHTEAYIAPPGGSEHQTGLALDLSCPAIDLDLVEEFEATKEGIWLAKNAPLYGFIIRYPKGKEDITGYSYEPWHIRYVTKPVAHFLAITKMTLDEYYQIRN